MIDSSMRESGWGRGQKANKICGQAKSGRGCPTSVAELRIDWG